MPGRKREDDAGPPDDGEPQPQAPIDGELCPECGASWDCIHKAAAREAEALEREEAMRRLQMAGSEPPEPGSAAEVAERVDQELRKQRSGRRKKAEEAAAQVSALDIVIEDSDLEEFLETVYTLDTAEARMRRQRVGAAKKGIKELVKGKYRHTLNSAQDGEHSGFVVCGHYRFKPEALEHGEEEVTTTRRPGMDWEDLDIREVGLLPGV